MATLADLYTECVRGLEHLIVTLNKEGCLVVHHGHVRIDEILEAYGRVKIWGDQTNADLSGQEDSLDNTLRNDSELEDLTRAILTRLASFIQKASSIAEQTNDAVIGSDQDSSSSGSDSDSEGDSGSDEDLDSDEDDNSSEDNSGTEASKGASTSSTPNASGAQSQRLERRLRSIRPIIQQIQAQIRTLFSLSSLLRRPRAIKQDTRIAHTPTTYYTNVEPHDKPNEQHDGFDGKHDEFDKQDDEYRKWCYSKIYFWRRSAMENGTFVYSTLDEDIDTPWLAERLVQANARRRDQKRYWRDHPYAPSQAADRNLSHSRVDIPENLPEPKDKASNDAVMDDRQRWQLDVLHDLRPYVCTFQECSDANKLYASRQEWWYHELSMHRFRYVCQKRGCGLIFTRRQDIAAHLKRHDTMVSIPTEHLDLLMDLCKRHVEDANDEEPCIFCGEGSLSELATGEHISKHMEELAPYGLPAFGESNQSDVNSKDNDGRTPLSRAAQSGQEDAVKLLLAAGADVDSKDNSDWTPLLRAVKNGHENAIQLLLAAGADVNLKDDFGRTPLFWAAESGEEDAVKLLLAAGADVDSKDDFSRTPLSWAARNGRENAIKLLLAAGADVDSKDDFGRTPLFWAAESGEEDAVKLLLAAGADVDSKDNGGRTPLSWARSEAVAGLLLAAGADVDSKDNDSRTPLSWDS